MKKYLFVILVMVSVMVSCKKDQPDNPKENIPPEVEFLTPVNETSIQVGDTLKVIANASDKDGTITKVLFYQNNQLYVIDSVKPWEQQMVFTTPQQVILMLKAIDNDNASATSDQVLVNVTNTQGSEITIYRSPSYTIHEYDNVTFTVHAYFPNHKTIKTDFYLNDQLYGSDPSGDCVFTVDSIPAGSYSYYAIAEDEVGNTAKSDPSFFTVSPNKPPEVEINSPQPGNSVYYPGQNVYIDVDASDNDGYVEYIEILVDDSIIATEDASWAYATWLPQTSGEHKIYARAYDDKNAVGYSDTVAVTILPGLIMDGIISDLTYSEDNSIVFGIDKTNHKLLLINPYDITIEKVDLPYAQPVAFDYSITDKKLYIVYQFTGDISVWDNDNHSLSLMNFSNTHDGRDIAVDEINRRIYVLSDAGLLILDMDNGNVLEEDNSLEGRSIVIDPVNRWLFSYRPYTPATLLKYSVANDNFQLIQTKSDAGSNPRHIAICPNYDFVVLPCGGGNGYGYTLFAFDTQNIENVLGEFDIGTYPKYAAFSPDGNTLFGVNGDPYDNFIYVMRTDDYSLKEKIPLPNADDYAVLTTNSSADKIIAFTYNTYNDKNHVLYFMDLK